MKMDRGQKAKQRLDRMNQAPRCLAKTRRGTACQCPAMKGKKRCRLHGGKSPGGPIGPANGRFVHGLYSKAVRADIAMLRVMAEVDVDVLKAD